MHIVVAIKQVPETNAVRMDEATGTMVREGVEAILNPLDLYAVEVALQLRQLHGGSITCITMGPPAAARALREAISMGADEGVLVCGREFAGADTWATSRALAAAIGKLAAVDLIVCGERATDGDTGQVGPGIAAFCDLPVATYVSHCELRGEVLHVHRLVEDGYDVLDVDLPAVLTVVKEIADPRLPTLRGKQRARAATLTQWGASDVGLSATEIGLQGSPTRVVKIHRPQVARDCERLIASDDASIQAAANRVVDYLRQKEIL